MIKVMNSESVLSINSVLDQSNLRKSEFNSLIFESCIIEGGSAIQNMLQFNVEIEAEEAIIKTRSKLY